MQEQAMAETSRPFPEINRLIHEPARLAILTVLSHCRSADFLFLRSATGLTKGNLSVQISRLEEAGLVNVKKTIRKKKMLTTISMTPSSRKAMVEYWRTIEAIRAQAGSLLGSSLARSH